MQQHNRSWNIWWRKWKYELGEEIPNPQEIKKILDEYVIGQEDAKNLYQLQYTIIIKE